MKQGLTLQEKLRDLRYNSGKKSLEDVSEATGISTTALSTYENDELKDVPHTNIVTLAKYYGVTTDYLLGLTENATAPDADLRSLHIDDKTVDLLKSGSINNRLLCELITHPDFMDFLTDLEIYVDGLAGVQIQSLNAVVDVIRKQLQDGRGLNLTYEVLDGIRNHGMRMKPETLEGQVVRLSDKIAYMHHDLDDVFKELRAMHKDDSDAAPDNLIADEFNKVLDDLEREYSADEKPNKNLMNLLFYYFTRELKMPRNRLTVEEVSVLEGIFLRSGRYKEQLRQMNKGRRK